jgi:hypothetical protein
MSGEMGHPLSPAAVEVVGADRVKQGVEVRILMNVVLVAEI